MTEIQSILKESRRFPPAPEFTAAAHVKGMAEYEKLYKEAADHPDEFWSRIARELHWFKTWDRVLTWNPPDARWFDGATTNISYNCLDRHAATWRRNKAALIWEGEPGEERVLTYGDLLREVSRFAHVLRHRFHVKTGDRVMIYLPMVPELPIAMLACARIGAVHSVIFGGFTADALKDRINDAEAKLVVTADGGWRRGQEVPLKANVDEALKSTPTVKDCIILRRTGTKVPVQPGRDHWWHELMANAKPDVAAEPLDSEAMLFTLYTSGTTGKPKGIVHTTGGYMVQTYLTAKWIFDLKEEDVYWCTADIGWVTGHSYIAYGPLLNGATVVMYEGAPNHPAQDRFWEIVEKYRVTILYTAPTAIRAFVKWGTQWPEKHDLTSLRLLGTVGEPINPEAWMWYREEIGGGKCPIVDTWWQTETGAIMISPLPGATPTTPGTATRPFPGIVAEIVNKEGKALAPNEGGYLVIRKPWPGMLRGIYKDPERYKKQYWSQVPGSYFTGDGARKDTDGYFWIMGRVDDVIKVAGHRLGTMEVESALVSAEGVAEAAVVGRPDEVKGEAIVAFVTLKGGVKASPELKQTLREHVAKSIGAIARPEEIRFTDTLPKTRSGKIMRRLLREIASGNTPKGDTTTLEDFSVLAKLREDEE